MALELYLIDAEVTPEQYPALKQPNMEFFIGPFDKLEPVWKRCRWMGVEVDYFGDFRMDSPIIVRLLEEKEALIGKAFLRKPFGEEANREMLRFFTLLEQAQREGRHVLALCD